MKKPGGTIPNPNAGALGAPAVIPNPGFSVSIRAEENLKLAVCYARHEFRVSRPVTPASITAIGVRALKDLKIAEEEHVNPTDKPAITTTGLERLTIWRNTFVTTWD
jgi:hypothetical protein